MKMLVMHPGQYISRAFLSDDMTQTKLAKKLNVSTSAISRLLNGKADLSAEMAIKLSENLGRSPESWMQMQTEFSLKRARSRTSTAKMKAAMA